MRSDKLFLFSSSFLSKGAKQFILLFCPSICVNYDRMLHESYFFSNFLIVLPINFLKCTAIFVKSSLIKALGQILNVWISKNKCSDRIIEV